MKEYQGIDFEVVMESDDEWKEWIRRAFNTHCLSSADEFVNRFDFYGCKVKGIEKKHNAPDIITLVPQRVEVVQGSSGGMPDMTRNDSFWNFCTLIWDSYPTANINSFQCHHGCSIGIHITVDFREGVTLEFKGALSVVSADWEKFGKEVLVKMGRARPESRGEK